MEGADADVFESYHDSQLGDDRRSSFLHRRHLFGLGVDGDKCRSRCEVLDCGQFSESDFSFLDLAQITELSTQNRNLIGINLRNGADYYRDETLSLAIVINPSAELTTFTFPQIQNPNAPRYGVLSAFYGAAPLPSTVTSPTITKPLISWKCAACKTAAAGLAVVIAALAIHAIIPAALTAAVSAFFSAHGLSITAAGADTFIKAMIGAPIHSILDALCVKVGLCP